MHFIRRFIINADAYDIKMEEVDAWLIVPPCHFPPLLPLSFSRESKREANTPILINSRGISIYSSSRNTRMRGGRGMGPLPLHSRYFSTGQPFLSRPFPTFLLPECKFFSLVPKNNRLSKASRPIARPPSASSHLVLQSRWYVRAFSIASFRLIDEIVFVSMQREREPKRRWNCSDVSEIFFDENRCPSRVVKFFLILSTRSGREGWLEVERSFLSRGFLLKNFQKKIGEIS